MKPRWYLSEAVGPENCEAAWILFRLDKPLVDMARALRDSLIGDEQRFPGSWGSITMRGRAMVNVIKDVDDDLFDTIIAGAESLYDSFSSLYRLRPDFDEAEFLKLTEDSAWRSECHGLKVYADTAYIVAMDKYSSHEVESLDINFLLFDYE